MKIDLTCEYVMNNATQGVATCNSSINTDPTMIYVVISLILVFSFWNLYVFSKNHVKPFFVPEEDE